MENVGSKFAYGTILLATTDARQKLDADEVITSSSPTVTLLSLLTSRGIRDETLDWMHSDASQLAA